jgi:hypothetical protein
MALARGVGSARVGAAHDEKVPPGSARNERTMGRLSKQGLA